MPGVPPVVFMYIGIRLLDLFVCKELSLFFLVIRYNEGDVMKTLTQLSESRVEPALHTFYDDKNGLENYLNIIIDHAKQSINSSFWNKTNLSLKATAGMRGISIRHQNWIIDNVRRTLNGSSFASADVDSRVISGEEEALYAYIALHATKSYGLGEGNLSFSAADLGGSSKQISFRLQSNSSLCVPNYFYNTKTESYFVYAR